MSTDTATQRTKLEAAIVTARALEQTATDAADDARYSARRKTPRLVRLLVAQRDAMTARGDAIRALERFDADAALEGARAVALEVATVLDVERVEDIAGVGVDLYFTGTRHVAMRARFDPRQGRWHVASFAAPGDEFSSAREWLETDGLAAGLLERHRGLEA